MLQKSLVRRGSKKIRHNAGRLPKKPVYIINLMYAIVEINGQQFKAEEGKKLFVHHIKDVEAGQTVEFDNHCRCTSCRGCKSSSRSSEPTRKG